MAQTMAVGRAGSGNDVDTALELFEAGIAKEHIGKMSDAVQFYRQAFKINDKVDKVYREKHFSKKPQPSHGTEELVQGVNSLTLKDGKASHGKDKEILSNDDKDNSCALLEYFTDDILIHVLKYLAAVDAPSWVSLSLTCKRLAHLGFDSSSLWESISLDTYRALYPYLSVKDIDHQAMTKYNGWKNMYFKKPFVKFGGIYISTCTYLREGNAADSVSWSNPIHMITYYRYVRFFKSGTCLRLLTVSEPPEVVPKFTKEWKSNGLKDVYNGFWSLDEEGKLTIEGEGVIPNYQFTQEFQINTYGRRKHNQLKWIRSFCISDENVQSNFLLRNEKWFTFSRVKSYHIE